MMTNKAMNERGKKQRLFQWQALPEPKMPWSTFKRMITMERFKNLFGAERPDEVLREWRRCMGVTSYQQVTPNKKIYNYE
jgi:hypothetical protein